MEPSKDANVQYKDKPQASDTIHVTSLSTRAN